MRDTPLESQLFTWKDWDGDHECMTYYNVVLKMQIGKYLPGTPFDIAYILFDKSILQLCQSGEMKDGFTPDCVMGEYKLGLTITETMKE